MSANVVTRWDLKPCSCEDSGDLKSGALSQVDVGTSSLGNVATVWLRLQTDDH